jgi:hypothetical protein
VLSRLRVRPGLVIAAVATAMSGLLAAPATGVTLTGQGVDACAAPSLATMQAWKSASPYTAMGIYVGGVNRGCSQPNLTASWVTTVASEGWQLIPTWVGLQAPCNSSRFEAMTAADAAEQGTQDAAAAVSAMSALGLGTGNPVYDDMEAYSTSSASCVAAVEAYLDAWTVQLHASGYLSGVYSSAASGITNLVQEAEAHNGYHLPDDIWFAHWNDSATTTGDSYVPDTLWAAHQRIHQYAGGHTETYDGVTVNVDNDAVDAAVAVPGTSPTDATAAPTVTVSPEPVSTTAATVPVTWTATQATGTTPPTSDVRVRSASSTAAYGSWSTPSKWSGITATSVEATIAAGQARCFSVRSTSAAGTTSTWSAPRCVSRPLDDRSLTRGSGWTSQSTSTAYGGTLTNTTRKGAVLSRTVPTVHQIGVLANTCSTCGRVEVTIGSHVVTTLHLHTAKTDHQRLVLTPVFSSRKGTLRLTTTTTGKPVKIDGVVLLRKTPS